MSDASVLAPPSALRPRRNLRWVAIGIIAVCLGGLGSAFLYSSLADAHAVVRVNRTIFRGQTIAAADLGAITIGSSVGLDTVAGERADTLIGKTALVDLPAGSLVVPSSIGEAEVKRDQSRLGLRLASGRLPVSALPPGTPVLLVPIAKDAQSQPDGPSVIAEIATAPVAQTDGSTVLDVSVPVGETERIARLAAADLIVLVRKAVS